MNDIIVKNLVKRYGEKTVLNEFNAVFPAGVTTALMGPSGCGKTTLSAILMGFVKADSGSISGIPAHISAVFQEDRLCEDFDAVANVRLVTGKKVPLPEIEACLRDLGLENSLHQPVRALSGGMKRRVAIARALLAESELLLLDEPFKGLDETTRSAVMTYVQQKTAGKTVILITHDPAEAAALGTGTVRMETII